MSTTTLTRCTPTSTSGPRCWRRWRLPETGHKSGRPAARRARRRLTAGERRASILGAAAGVFAGRGYEAARIEEIAAAGGVSKALIYEHFSSKRDLYVEIVRSGTEESLSRVANAVTPGAAGVGLLEAAVGAFLDFVAERPDTWRVITQQVPDSTIVAVDESMRRKAVSAIAGLVARDPATRDQRLSSPELEQIAEMINGATLAVVNWWLEHPSTTREEIASNLMSFLWLGMERIRVGARYGQPSTHTGTIGKQ